MLGIESAPIDYVDDGRRHSVKVGDLMDIEIEDFVPPGNPGGEVERLTGMFHPVNSTLTIAKANRLQRAAKHLETLRPAFAEWAAGDVYVCKKTATYRYRFGALSKSVTAWDSAVREIFATPEDFAFAAMVLGAEKPAALPAPAAKVERANVVKLAA